MIKHTLTGHIGKVFSARFGNQNKVVYSFFFLIIFLERNLTNLRILKAFYYYYYYLKISGSHDRTLKVWDLLKGYCVDHLKELF